MTTKWMEATLREAADTAKNDFAAMLQDGITELVNLRSEVKSLRVWREQQAAEDAAKLEGLQAENERLREQVAGFPDLLNQEADRHLVQYAALERQLASLQAQYKEIDERNTELATLMLHLKEQIATAEAACGAMRNLLEQFSVLIENLRVACNDPSWFHGVNIDKLYQVYRTAGKLSKRVTKEALTDVGQQAMERVQRTEKALETIARDTEGHPGIAWLNTVAREGLGQKEAKDA